MFKLILIIAMGGTSYESGVATSQAEYTFPSKKACEEAQTYYLSHAFSNRMNWSPSYQNKGFVIQANCWPNK